jgi:hypothetical protein
MCHFLKFLAKIIDKIMEYSKMGTLGENMNKNDAIKNTYNKLANDYDTFLVTIQPGE